MPPLQGIFVRRSESCGRGRVDMFRRRGLTVFGFDHHRILRHRISLLNPRQALDQQGKTPYRHLQESAEYFRVLQCASWSNWKAEFFPVLPGPVSGPRLAVLPCWIIWTARPECNGEPRAWVQMFAGASCGGDESLWPPANESATGLLRMDPRSLTCTRESFNFQAQTALL